MMFRRREVANLLDGKMLQSMLMNSHHTTASNANRHQFICLDDGFLCSAACLS